MVKIFVASFNRASDGALAFLKDKLRENNMLAVNYNDAYYILACGDRSETFDFALKQFRKGIPIIHLWAGEISQGTYDEVYRHSITLMSMMQLVTNEKAKERVIGFCKSIDKTPNCFVVGNVMLDDLAVDESFLPDKPFTVVLYNPPVDRETTKAELVQIMNILKKDKQKYVWIEPNGDTNSDLINSFVTEPNRPRPLFLGLIKNCSRFITNSSCQFYEAPFLMKPEDIVSIGVRNQNRESKHSNMCIGNASKNIILILKENLL